MTLLTLGVFGTSSKEHEKRVPIHPEQLGWISEEVRQKLIFEKGYGLSFGVSDDELRSQTGGVIEREELFEKCDIALLAKPVRKDFVSMKEGTIHWGWPHCVQQQAITQTAIDRKLTLIAWEASETIKRAIEIRNGVIQNPKILSFQNRSEDFPHPVLT